MTGKNRWSERQPSQSMPLWGTSSEASWTTDFSAVLIALQNISSLPAEQGSVWLAQRDLLCLSSPALLCFLWLKQTTVVGKFGVCECIHVGCFSEEHQVQRRMEGVALKGADPTFSELVTAWCFHWTGPYNSCRRALLCGHKQETTPKRASWLL